MKKILILVSFLLILSGCVSQDVSQDEQLGGGFANANWTVVSSFDGYQTKLDPTKVSNGANPQGQNTTVNEGDRISIRNLGYEIFPATISASTSKERITSMHTFRRRDGENIIIRGRGTVLEYFEEDNDTWEIMATGLTDDKEFGFADYNINTDLSSYVYFGNAVDDFSRWTGNHSLLDGALSLGDSTVIVDDSSGFLLTGGTIVACGVELPYSSLATTTDTFTLTGTSTVACADNRSVSEAIETFSDNPKGNIYLVDSNRLFIAGVASTSQAIFFSEYGNAEVYLTDLITDSTDTSAGIFNLGEGGGAVIGMAADEVSVYFFKRSTIRKATLSDTIYTLGTLKPFDGKSQTIGGTNAKSVFSGGNKVFFITPDKQIMDLGRANNLDFPQISRISDIINPTVSEFSFDESVGIVFNDRAFFAVRSQSTLSANNVVLVWNLSTKKWDSPILGWNVSEFIIYDDGVSEELYFGDAISPNVYKVNTIASDNDFEVTANWRSKQFDFDKPHAQKQMVDMFIDGYIAEGTTISVSLLLDEDGFTQTFTHDINGTDDNIIYDSGEFNALGLSAFGTKRFGSQEDLSGKKKFRVYLGKDFRPAPFYNAQVEFASDGDSQNWEILNFGFRVREYSNPEKRDLYQSFK